MSLLTFRTSVIGPVVDVRIAPAGAPFAGQVPAYMQVKMLVDTGADFTSVDERLLAAWKLIPSTAVFSRSVHGAAPAKGFNLSVIIQDPSGQGSEWAFPSIDVIKRDQAAFAGLQIKGLIGRDILDCGVLTYDGIGGTFSLKF